ncbi:MAG: hypothetical protein NT039_02190 [Candidatus Berkelbacteria bacterium]|nr:hypothetical protein [Candidatus Berkelbacteria bacterium]
MKTEKMKTRIIIKFISTTVIFVLFLGLIIFYRDFAQIAKTKAQGTQNSTSGTGAGIDPYGPGVGAGVNPNSAGTGAGTNPGTGTNPDTGTTGSGTTTSSGGSADQEGGCGEKDTSCKEPNPLTPWQGDVKDSLSESLKQSNITTAWGLTLDFINVIAIFMLLAIAFANILHIDAENWNFKRLIPALVIGLILANFSHLICRAIIDFAAMLMNFFVPKNETMNVSFNLIIGMWSDLIQNPIGGALGIAAIVGFMFLGLGCAAIVVAFILLFLPAIIILILFLMLAVRVYVIWFLVIVSPIAFFTIMFSVFQKQIEWWWKWFFQWVFMGPIVYFMIYIAEGFARSDMFQNAGGTLPCFDPTAGEQVSGLSKYLFVNALLVLAIIIPYMMGKQIFAPLWKYFGQYAAKAGGGLLLGAGTGATKLLGKGLKATRIPVVSHLGGLMEKQINPMYLPGAIGGLAKSYKEAQEKKIQADWTTSLRKNPVARFLIGEGLDNMSTQKVLEGREQGRLRGWNAEDLVRWMNTGVEKGDREKRAQGVNWLQAMAGDSGRPEEQRKAKQALMALRVHESDVSNPLDIDKLAGVAQRSGGLKTLREEDKTSPDFGKFKGFEARKPIRQTPKERKRLDRLWGRNPLQPTMEQAHPVQVMNPSAPPPPAPRPPRPRRGPTPPPPPPPRPPRPRPPGAGPTPHPGAGPGAGPPPVGPPPAGGGFGTPAPGGPATPHGGPATPPGGAPPGGTPPVPPP